MLTYADVAGVTPPTGIGISLCKSKGWLATARRNAAKEQVSRQLCR
jgi:hypothetical protein